MFEFLASHRKKFVYIPLIIYWLLLIVATTLPAQAMPKTGVSDKFEHFAAYFGLAVFLNLTFMLQTKYLFLRRYSYLLTFLFIAVYAALDELHQLFIPGRYCDVLDWTSDVIGAGLGILIIFILSKIFKFKSESQFG